MNSLFFGLDIGSSTIKALSLKRENNMLFVDSVAVAPTTVRGVISESASDLAELARTISEMLERADIAVRNVNLAIPESQSYAKIIELPQLSSAEIGEALKWEVEQYIPLPLSEVQLDWQILEKKENDGRKLMSVLVVAIAKTTLQKYEKILALSGLAPHVIETEMISVHRALAPLLDQKTASLVMHIGATTTDIIIVKNGTIGMIFSLNLGGGALTRAVSVELGVDLSHAETLKKAYGLSAEAFDGRIGRALLPTLATIVGDLKKAILLYKEKSQNEEIKQIVLSGGGVLLPGLQAYLASALGVQVVFSNCWQIHNISNVPPEIQKTAPDFNVVTGLALREA